MIVGMEVVRTGADTDYSTGRMGTIIEKNVLQMKYRVRWHTECNGKPINIRTWVSEHQIKQREL